MADIGKLIVGDHRDPQEELTALFPSDGTDTLAGARTRARGIIESGGIAADEQLRVIKALRDAEPRLSLKPATYLAEQLRG